MSIIKFDISDKLVLKKKHPCGGNVFTVLRLGTDIRIRCDLCGRDMTWDREKLERAIKKVLNPNEE